jgi:hypothetical protein
MEVKMKNLRKIIENEKNSKENMSFLEGSIVKLFYLHYYKEVNSLIEKLNEKYSNTLILLRKKDKETFNLEEYFKINDIKIRRIIEKKLTQESFLKDFSKLKMEFIEAHISLLIRHLVSVILYIEIKTDQLDAYIYSENLEHLENTELAQFLLYY